MRINPSAFGDCIEKIASRGRITQGEARQILQQVADCAEQMRQTGEDDPFVKAAGEMAAELKETARKDHLDAIRNATIRNRRFAEAFAAKDPVKSLKVVEGNLVYLPGQRFLPQCREPRPRLGTSLERCRHQPAQAGPPIRHCTQR